MLLEQLSRNMICQTIAPFVSVEVATEVGGDAMETVDYCKQTLESILGIFDN